MRHLRGHPLSIYAKQGHYLTSRVIYLKFHLFNCVFKRVLVFITKFKLASFADDNTLYADSKDIQILIEIIKRKIDIIVS